MGGIELALGWSGGSMKGRQEASMGDREDGHERGGAFFSHTPVPTTPLRQLQQYHALCRDDAVGKAWPRFRHTSIFTT